MNDLKQGIKQDRVPPGADRASKDFGKGKNDSRGKNDRNSRGGGGGGRGGGSADRHNRDNRDRNRSNGSGGHGPPRGDASGGPKGGGSFGAKLSGAAFSDSELLTDIPRKKFTGRCRLFVGNLPTEVKEQELKELFTPHGDISECYLSGKGFAFLRLDTRAHAESAKEALDGKSIKGRQMRVRFAVHGATIRIKELAPVVSNEMLHLTFSAFGDVERAVHVVDEKGKPTGVGIIEFERKTSAMDALQQIKERVFLMTANSRPLQAEIVEPKDEEDGLSERMLQKTPQLMKERELGPRFAALNSFEHVYGQRWKELYENEKRSRDELEQTLSEARRRLDADMEIAYEDYKTQLLREDLQRRQQELERLEAAKRARMRGIDQGPPPFGGMGGGPGMNRMQGGGPGQHRGSPAPLMDGPMGRQPPTFGPGGGQRGPPPSNGMGLFGVSGPSGHGQGGGPRSMADQDPHKMNDVQKLLQSFKDQGPGRPPLDFFGGNPGRGPMNMPGGGPMGGPGGMPNSLLSVMGPFANALSGGPPRPPPGMMPPPQPLLDFGHPAEKRPRH